MRTLEDKAMTWTAGAVVFIRAAGGRIEGTRPAAFVFSTPTGLAWVEPSYADPAGASSTALHLRDGLVEADGDGVKITTPGGEVVLVSPYEPEDVDLVGDALEWFAGYVAQSGRTWAEERAKVQGIIFPSASR